MFRKLLILLFVAMLFALILRGQHYSSFDNMLHALYKNTVPVIKPQQLHSKVIKNESLFILDARSKGEYAVSHLKNARFVGEDPDLAAVKDIPKDSRIAVYCSVGYRSERVGEKLLKAGYKNVYNLYGGIFGWVNEGYPVYLGKEQTDKVHAYNKAWGIWLKKGTKIYE